MKFGRFPGQEEALRARLQEIKDDGKRAATRRMFLGMAIGGVVAGGGVGAACTLTRGAGAVPADENDKPRDPAKPRLPERRHAWHDVAEGPIDELLRSGGSFLAHVETADDVDDVLWLGVTRIAHEVHARPAEHAQLREFLVMVLGRKAVPSHVALWVDLLRKTRRRPR